jgi:hypothetical protein
MLLSSQSCKGKRHRRRMEARGMAGATRAVTSQQVRNAVGSVAFGKLRKWQFLL